jgi:hypothetical protein
MRRRSKPVKPAIAVKAWWKVATVAAVLAIAPVVNAHNPDTSYARVFIRTNAVAVRLTYDVFTLLNVANLDANSDQQVTRAELSRNLQSIEKFIRAAVSMEIDGQPADIGELRDAAWPPDSGDAIAAKDWHTANGLIAFQFHRPVVSAPKELSLGFDIFDAFGQRHIVLGVFENNGRTHEVTFTRDEPDYLYDIAYAASGDTAVTAPTVKQNIWSALLRFLRLGVEHIFLGYDHICFLVALIVASRLREVVKIVTAFTAAHSITLILAALKIVSLPVRLVECAIALTIVYVAIENLWTKPDARRWPLAFGFGLIHGFGFASVLSQLGLPAMGTIRCLLSFNVGVELGQLAIVLALVPAILALRRWRHGKTVGLALSIAVALFGAGWFAERAFRLNFMPL